MAPDTPKHEQIVQLEKAMRPYCAELPEAGHLFMEGMYVRCLEVPANSLVVGKTHKHPHVLIVLKGCAEVVTEFGRDFVLPGSVAPGKPGVKRAILAYDDLLFATVHHNPWDIDDIEVLENHFVKDEDYLLEEVS